MLHALRNKLRQQTEVYISFVPIPLVGVRWHASKLLVRKEGKCSARSARKFSFLLRSSARIAKRFITVER